MKSSSNDLPGADCCPAAASPPAWPESPGGRDEALAALSKALGHPARVAIVRQLGATNACVSDIVGALPLAQSTVSQHLKVLKEAGLVRGEVEGPRVCYCLEPGALASMRALLEEL